MEAFVEPAANKFQFAIDSSFGKAQQLRGLLGGKPEKETELNHAAFAGIDLVELAQHAIQIDHFDLPGIDPGQLFVEGNRNAAVSFLSSFAASVINQDTRIRRAERL
jgi:hypothetical protein